MRQPATKAKPAPPSVTIPVAARPRPPAWVLAGLLVLVTIATYWPATRWDFVNLDDDHHVTSNPVVQKGLTLEGLKWACVNPVADNWHPLTTWSHMLVCQIGGLNSGRHHLANVVLHALNGGLVFVFLRLMTGARWRSLLVAALFAVHPLRVESVAWVSERKDVLSAFFGLLALIAYARYAEVQSLESKVQSQKCGVRGSWSLSHLPSSIFYLLALLLFALGLMSKPMLVTWPFVMLLLDYWPLGRMQNAECRMQNAGVADTEHATRNTLPVPRSSILPLLVEKIPFFGLAALMSVVAFMVQQRGGSLASGEHLPLGLRAENALISYCRHLGKLYWPVDLAVFYPYAGQWPLGQVVLSGGLILGVSVQVWIGRRRLPYLLMGWLWFVGMLVPVIGLVQTGGQAMADRHSYLPSLGVLVFAVWGGSELTRGRRYPALALSVAVAAAIAFCLALTRLQLSYWKDSEALFRHAIEVTENNYLAHNNLGYALDQQGKLDEAIRHYQEAVRLSPYSAEPHNDLGAALVKKGQLDAAIRQYQEALRLKPDQADIHNNLGASLDRQGQADEAIRQFQEALRLKPNHAEAHNNLGLALAKQGQLDEAIRQFQEVLRLKPDHAEAHNNLGLALGRKGQVEEAIRQYREAIRLKGDYPEAHNNLGAALDDKGQSEEAIGQYQEALRGKPDYAEAHYNLGNAFGRKGQTDQAIRQYEEALRLKPDYAEAHNNLGGAFYRQRRIGEAIQEFQEALRLKPDFAGARRNLEVVLANGVRSESPPSGATNR